MMGIGKEVTDFAGSQIQASLCRTAATIGSKPRNKNSFPQLTSRIVDLDDVSNLRVQSLSKDGRRLRQTEIAVAPPSPEKKRPRVLDAIRESASFNLGRWDQDNGSEYISLGDGSVGAVVPELGDELEDVSAGRKQTMRSNLASVKPMRDWIPLASRFLQELMSLEGRGRVEPACSKCAKPVVEVFRCKACWGHKLFCQGCIVEEHQTRPFHFVESWNGDYFEKVTLASLGLVIQLGHDHGEECLVKHRGHTGFVVVDLDGLQDIVVDFCACKPIKEAGEYWEQLMQKELYPATVEDPQTAFTFRTLSFFHTLTLKGKVSQYDFYHSLEARTDGAGLREVKDRYDSFVRVMRQWRYLKLLKRGGVGNDPSRSLEDIQDGELAVRCVACPRPEVNLPPDWQTGTALSKQFLYHKFISIDACFRLKRRKISSETRDPGLFTGLAYFVRQPEYKRWMESLPDQKSTSSCSGLAAVKQANTKFNRGYDSSGAILCLCARHKIVEPTGTVDTKRGEKYGLSDWAVGSSQRHWGTFLIRILCYDIACQYHKHFFERMARLPAVASIGLHRDWWKFAVPKLHIQGHERSCQENFALHFILGAEQTDGEGIERHWANLGPIATSMREMGPGHRRDTLDDHFGGWNWLKISRLGIQLRKRRRDAREQTLIQAQELLDFSEGQAEHIEE
ncbi:hypothetical protein VNI00_019007 [Paramarasmius palmivorus]|uniref:CxC2-like cysteine cluster KDZ transposase-associated domain-containing protein n=1 Tax=Paramarasmius palmivorus TaxID=297713 RepID=A0AAW0ASD9_9AGAR